MSDHPEFPENETIEAKKARLARQAAAIDRELAELAELERLAAKFKYVLSAPASIDSAPANVDNSPAATETSPPAEPTPKNVLLASTGLFRIPAAFANPMPETVSALTEVYKRHPHSPYLAVTFRVRANYDGLLRRIVREIGSLRIAEIGKIEVEAVYNGWTSAGKLHMANSLVGMLRQIFNFGMTVLEDAECARVSTVMRTIKVKAPVSKIERLTVEHVNAIRNEAHNVDWHSIALAQVIQFELKFRQVDVIGEWAPIAEAGESDVVLGEQKWMRGLRWSQIDRDMVLRHVTSNFLEKRKEIIADLKQYPSIMEELDWVGKIPTDGPMIICEPTGAPYSAVEFRRKWRIVASKAGVPANIRNADSSHEDAVEQTTEGPKVVRVIDQRSVH